jgi:hypothetical protein
MKQNLTAKLLVILLISLITGFIYAQNLPVHIEPTFGNHLDAGLAEQDAYIEKIPGSGQIWRVTNEDVNQFIEAPLYATVGLNRHNPFDSTFNGPFVKGRALGLTLGEWLEPSGTATYDCAFGQGSIEASFENMVPNGIYTMWYFFAPTPPMEPFLGAYDLPVGARDGSENIFQADAAGNASFEASFEPCLQLSGVQLAAGLGAAWHSDGKTYGSSPGPFGLGTQVPLFTFFPRAEELASTTAYTFQRQDLSLFPQNDISGSKATLMRSDEGITVAVETMDLPVDEATGDAIYTMWVPVFNNPELCSDGSCGIDDLPPPVGNGDPAIKANVMWVAGTTIEDGWGSLGGFLAVGDASKAIFPGDGLVDPHKAEIHFILRNHGPMIPGHLEEQLGTVWGGCDLEHEGNPEFIPENGGFPCHDPQAGAFLP